MARKIARSRAFDRAFKKKPPDMQAAILKTLKALEEGSTASGLGVKKMQGHRDIWEARVDRSNRVTFQRDSDTLYLRANCNHDVLGAP